MHVSTCEIVFVKYMKAPNNEIKNCTLKQKKKTKNKKTNKFKIKTKTNVC